MSEHSSEKFWNRQFDLGGNTPAWWFDVAFSLRTAADVLESFKGPRTFKTKETVTRSDYEKQSVGRVHAMLLAMATECLLKALWLKYGGTLAKDGKYYPIPKTTDHRLDQLANAVSQKGAISFTQQELEHLKRVSLWIASGRYPIPKNSQDNSTRHKAFIGDPFVKLRTFMQKLEKELGCTMNFESE